MKRYFQIFSNSWNDIFILFDRHHYSPVKFVPAIHRRFIKDLDTEGEKRKSWYDKWTFLGMRTQKIERL